MGRINVLSFEVANLIAAGEVVDRPASVVKELMENAIDSGADRITVEIQHGGVSLISVTDNGCGMAADELPIAIRPKAKNDIADNPPAKPSNPSVKLTALEDPTNKNNIITPYSHPKFQSIPKADILRYESPSVNCLNNT